MLKNYWNEVQWTSLFGFLAFRNGTDTADLRPSGELRRNQRSKPWSPSCGKSRDMMLEKCFSRCSSAWQLPPFVIAGCLIAATGAQSWSGCWHFPSLSPWWRTGGDSKRAHWRCIPVRRSLSKCAHGCRQSHRFLSDTGNCSELVAFNFSVSTF